ncbi:MAG: hypothetical protein EA355_03075 [Rhodobacteraceae bacterium]|nr:MAG: hypothetical protein EA355_03075 [Paracoccaceae bacterium]
MLSVLCTKNKDWTEEKIQKRFAEGFGRGVGRDYKPWLTVGRSAPSVGSSNRSGARTTGRVHHYLSDTERNAFLIYDWAASVVDIREQFPLDRGETRAIAEAMGVRHPTYPGTAVPVVMTTDFLLDTVVDGRTMQAARGETGGWACGPACAGEAGDRAALLGRARRRLGDCHPARPPARPHSEPDLAGGPLGAG